jgi:GntR family transcriptional regulator of arabinose operon
MHMGDEETQGNSSPDRTADGESATGGVELCEPDKYPGVLLKGGVSERKVSRERAPAQKPRKRIFKYARIKTDLSIQILEGQLRSHDRIPSLNEIVEKYKVSKITARRVLNDLISEGLVYASRGSGSFVADAASWRVKRRSQAGADGLLGVVFAHASGAFMSDIILGVDEEAFRRSAQIGLCLSNNSYEQEAEILQRLVRQGARRILIFPVLKFDCRELNPNIPLYLRIQEQGVRLLFLVCNIPNAPLPSITYNERNAFQRLVGAMCRKGCRSLAAVVRNDNASSTVERLQGFKDGALEQGLPYDESHVLQVPVESMDTVVSDASRGVVALLTGNGRFDGIVCSDEMVAGGVFEALDGIGLPADARPLVGGMGTIRNLHILKGHPYMLLEEDTRRLGREAASVILGERFPGVTWMDSTVSHQRIPVPLRIPKELK